MTDLATRGWRRSRVMVIGAHGQLGRAVMRAAPDAIAVARSDTAITADLLDRASIRDALASRPTRVILTAAYTNVIGCETDPIASAVNIEGTRAVVEEAAAIGAAVTFISTDYVFGGKGGPYDEATSPYPLNAYGRQKLAGEQIVLSVPGNLVVRTCQVFGDDPRRMNFVLRVLDVLRAGETVGASARMSGTPTYAPDLARALLEPAEGVRHVVGAELVSRFDLARRVALTHGLDPELVVDRHTPDTVNRPAVSWLTSRWPRTMTPLDEALRAIS